MPTVTLGNTAPIEAVKQDENSDAITRVPRPDLGNTVTTFVVPDELELGDTLKLVSSVYASHHSDDPAAWVESDDSVVAEALARDFHCPVGRPADWSEGVPTASSTAE